MKHYYLKRHKGIFYYYNHGHQLYGFRLTYRDKLGKAHEKSRRNLPDVKTAIKAKATARERQSKLVVTNNMNFKALCHHFLGYLSKNYNKKTTYKSYLHLLRNDAIPSIGQYKLIDLKPIMYRDKCLEPLAKKGLSHQTLVIINSRVQKVMNTAVKDQIISHNPIAHVDIPRAKRLPRREIMNDKQLGIFNHCLSHHSILIRAIFMTLELTGMRAGELLGLHWEDVDLDKKLVHIKYTRDAYGLRSPKTEHSNRTIRINDKLASILDEYQMYCMHKYHIKADKGYVFLGKHGHKLIPNRVSVELKKLLAECGLSKLRGRFTPHSFRHMFASRLIGSGVDPIAVSKVLGHSSPEITLKVYSQWANGNIPDVGKLISQASQQKGK